MLHILDYALAALFGWASIVEWQHVREGREEGRWDETVFPVFAAISLAYIASECLDHRWP